MADDVKALLQDIFGTDFSAYRYDSNAAVKRFFEKELSFADIEKAHDFIAAQHVTVKGRGGGEVDIPAVYEVKGTLYPIEGKPFLVQSALHANETAGLAGALLVMALSEARLLHEDVYVNIGTPHVTKQYFAALKANPDAPQESRDDFRGGVDEHGKRYTDPNRIPIDYREHDPNESPFMRRKHELDILGDNISGVLDIHTARGNMVVVTEHSDKQLLRDSPIRNLLDGLLEAIKSNSGTITYKESLSDRANVKAITGIEAGTHEAPESRVTAAEFTLMQLHNLGITPAKPRNAGKETGIFHEYPVGVKLTFGDMKRHGEVAADDQIYTARPIEGLSELPEGTEKIVVRKEDGSHAVQTLASARKEGPQGAPVFAVYQFDEMEAVQKGQTVAVAVPSGTTLSAPRDFNVLFVSKSSELYSDPAIGLFPVKGSEVDKVKFAYPCDHRMIRIEFDKKQQEIAR